MPSRTRCGSVSISSRSLKVPGSDSSALTATYFGPAILGMKPHLLPVGKPAPPRPRRPEALTSSTTWSSGPGASAARAGIRARPSCGESSVLAAQLGEQLLGCLRREVLAVLVIDA